MQGGIVLTSTVQPAARVNCTCQSERACSVPLHPTVRLHTGARLLLCEHITLSRIMHS